MKKIRTFFCFLLAMCSLLSAQASTCDPTMVLTNGNNSVILSTWQRADGYYFEISGQNLVNITAGCYVYINGNEQMQLLKANITTSSTLITVGPIQSTTVPKFYTPLYVLMPGEVSFGAVNAANLTFCPDGPLPRPKAITHNLSEDYLCKGSPVTFTATGFDDESVKWEVSSTQTGPWTTLAGNDTILTVSDLPVGTLFVKVSQGSHSAMTSLVVGVCCDVTGSKQQVIWKETFELSDDPSPNVSGSKKRYHNKYVGSTYKFATFDNTCAGAEGEGKVCDGYYAVVTNSSHANPALCGWPENKYDHTSNNGTSGFLIVNAGISDAVIYEQEIEPTGGFCTEGMWYNFSLYATNIAPATADPAIFILEIIEIDQAGRQTILSQWRTGEIEGSMMQNWYRYGTSFQPSSSAKKIIVRVWNAGGSENGNDIVMDDLQVSVCQPIAYSYVGDVSKKQKVSTGKDCGDTETITAVLEGKESDFFPNGAYYLWLHSLDGGNSFAEVEGLSGTGKSAIQYVTQYSVVPVQVYAIVANSRSVALEIKNGQSLTNACSTYAITDKVKISCEGEPTCVTPPTLVINPVAPICAETPQKVQLTAVATPTTSTQKITFSGQFVSGNEFDATYATANTYRVVASLTDGLCTATASTTIEVLANPTIQVTSDVTELTCEQPQATLTATSQQTVQFAWSTGQSTAIIQVTGAGTYSVQATDNNGCTSQKDVSLYDNIDYLEGDLFATPTEVFVGNPVQLAFLAKAGKVERLQWFCNDEPIELSDYQTDTPMIDCEYKVVASSNCNSVVDSVLVTVDWPTVFTPYQIDGYNDDFMGNMNMPLPLKIFTRFGAIIYQGEYGWNGYLSDGQMAMPGVYYYSVELPNGQTKTGTIEVYKQ